MKRITAFLVALAATSFIVLLSGCGQSGALYIPGDPSRMEVPPAGETASDQNEEDGEASAPE